ncbi:MAG: DUF86 domain-containing protein [Oscillospiraceae bacterium]|nr:DUF86 domain-containing protein [Oscillospiraceae bacterium]
MQRKDHIILNKILQEIEFTFSAMGDREFAEFKEDELLKRGICMTVINIGELVKGISSELRLKYSDIPWKDIAGFRDIAAHKYHTLDMDAVYNTVTRDFHIFEKNVKEILENETQ